MARSSTAKLKPAPGPETGVSGTTNWHGVLLTEPTLKLQHENAYGRPGTRGWGYWERIRRTDAAVAAAIDFHLGPIRDARVDVEPAEGVPGAEAHAEFVKWIFSSRMEPGWSAFAAETVTGALGTGFAIHEECWDDVEHPSLPSGKGVGITKFAQRLPSSLEPNCWVEKGGELDFVRQQGTDSNQWKRVDLPASKLFLLSWNREGANYAGYSLFRPVCYLAEVRAEIIRLPGVALMREGVGVPVVMPELNAPKLSEDEAEAMDAFLSRLVAHENAYARMPPGYKLEWTFSGSANKNHIIEVYNALGLAILSVAHAQQLVLGTSDTGSRAVGEVHERKAQEFTQGVVANLEAALNGRGRRPYEGPVRKMIDANWGPQKAYPTLKLTLKRSTLNPAAKVTATTSAVAAGVLTPTHEVENELREELGYSPIDEAEWEAAQAQKKAAADAIAKATSDTLKPDKAQGEEPEDGEDEKEEPEGMDAAVQTSALEASQAEWTPWRPLRPSEAALDFAMMARFLDDARAVYERGAKPLLVKALAEVLPKLGGAMRDGELSPDEVAALQIDLGDFERFVQRYLERAVREGAAQVRRELAKAQSALRAAAGDERDEVDQGEIDDDDTAALVQAQRRLLVRRTRTRLLQQLEDEAIDVMRTGGEPTQVVSRVTARLLDSSTLKADAGAVLTRAWNGGREMAARELGGVDEVELSAYLDGNTCSTCEALDGTLFAFESAEHDAHVPPLRNCEGGSKCRCVLVYRPRRA